MNIKSISYSRTIPTGSYSNEKIGVEIDLAPDESPEEAFAHAKELVESIHRQNNPHLWGDGGQPLPNDYVKANHIYALHPNGKVSDPISGNEINLQHDRIEVDIDNCKTIEELAKLKEGLPAKLISAYMNKMKELTIKPQIKC